MEKIEFEELNLEEFEEIEEVVTPAFGTIGCCSS